MFLWRVDTFLAFFTTSFWWDRTFVMRVDLFCWKCYRPERYLRICNLLLFSPCFLVRINYLLIARSISDPISWFSRPFPSYPLIATRWSASKLLDNKKSIVSQLKRLNIEHWTDSRPPRDKGGLKRQLCRAGLTPGPNTKEKRCSITTLAGS